MEPFAHHMGAIFELAGRIRRDMNTDNVPDLSSLRILFSQTDAHVLYDSVKVYHILI